MNSKTINSNYILVTGAAGFVGYHLSTKLLSEGLKVIGLDNMNDYYDVNLKKSRLNNLVSHENFTFLQQDLVDNDKLEEIFENYRPNIVVNLAAQAGVRYSIENPKAYIDSNIVGFANILEACRNFNVEHLLYASSSSVYGGNTISPFSEDHNVDHPVSLYAATKKSNELMAHTYSHLYGLPTTGLRFFTVYGDYGRPDMAYFSFTKNIIDGKSIKVFNKGKMMRDFTHVDDVVDAIVKLMHKKPQGIKGYNEQEDDVSSSFAPYKVYNIGNNKPVSLLYFIETIEKSVGKAAIKEYLEMQPGDVVSTYADISSLKTDIGFEPKTTIDEGINKFVKWYMSYYKIKEGEVN